MANWGTVFSMGKYQSIIYFSVSTCFEKPFLPTWASAKSHNLHLNSVYALENYQPFFFFFFPPPFFFKAYKIIWSTFHIESLGLTIKK